MYMILSIISWRGLMSSPPLLPLLDTVNTESVIHSCNRGNDLRQSYRHLVHLVGAPPFLRYHNSTLEDLLHVSTLLVCQDRSAGTSHAEKIGQTEPVF